MTHYYAYDTNSTVNVSEPAQIQNAQITLRHIPKPNSITIANFTETTSLSPSSGQFFCDYSPDTQFRDSNRVVHFNPADNGKSLTVNYIAIGTVFTADDANEIKAHMENSSLHGGGSNLQIGSGFSITDENVRDGFLQLNDPGLALQDGKLNSNAFYRLKHIDGVNGIDPTSSNYGNVDFSPGDVYADMGNYNFFINEGGSLRNLDTPSVRIVDNGGTDDTYYQIGDVFWSNDNGGGYRLRVDTNKSIGIEVPWENEYFTYLRYDVLPPATDSTRGAIRPGTGLSMDGDVLNCTLSAEPVKKFNRAQVVNRNEDWQDPDDFILNYYEQATEELILPLKFYNSAIKNIYNIRVTLLDGTELVRFDKYDYDAHWAMIDTGKPFYYTNDVYHYDYSSKKYFVALYIHNLPSTNQIVVHYTTDADGNIYDYEPPTPTFTSSRSAFPSDPYVATFCYRYDLNQLFLFDGLNWLAI